jgi:hypothetical protein
MRWVTSRFIHFDRVASCWLISRFIDPNASFSFIDPEAERPVDAVAFALPGAEIGQHEGVTTFNKLINFYKVKDPSLQELEKIVAAGVAYVMDGRKPEAGDRSAWIAVGLLAVAEGMLAMENSDADILLLASPVWDAVYIEAGIQLLRKSAGQVSDDPDTRQNSKFVSALARYRQTIARARGTATA